MDKPRYIETGTIIKHGDRTDASGDAVNGAIRRVIATHQRALLGVMARVVKAGGRYGQEVAGSRTTRLLDGTIIRTWVNPFGLAPTLISTVLAPREDAVEEVVCTLYLESGLLTLGLDGEYGDYYTARYKGTVHYGNFINGVRASWDCGAPLGDVILKDDTEMCGENKDSGESLIALGVKNNSAIRHTPASLFSGKLSLFVQSLYGADRPVATEVDGETTYEGYPHIKDLDEGEAGNNITIFGELLYSGYSTSGLVTTDDGYYIITLGSSTAAARKVRLSSCGEVARRIARQKQADGATHAEVNIADSCAFSSATGFHDELLETDFTSVGLNNLGAPLAFGWKFNWAGDKASVVLLTNEDPENADQVIAQKITASLVTVAITITEDGLDIQQETLSKQYCWPRNDFCLFWVPLLGVSMQTMDRRFIRCAPHPLLDPPPDWSDTPVYVWYAQKDETEKLVEVRSSYSFVAAHTDDSLATIAICGSGSGYVQQKLYEDMHIDTISVESLTARSINEAGPGNFTRRGAIVSDWGSAADGSDGDYLWTESDMGTKRGTCDGSSPQASDVGKVMCYVQNSDGSWDEPYPNGYFSKYWASYVQQYTLVGEDHENGNIAVVIPAFDCSSAIVARNSVLVTGLVSNQSVFSRSNLWAPSPQNRCSFGGGEARWEYPNAPYQQPTIQSPSTQEFDLMFYYGGGIPIMDYGPGPYWTNPTQSTTQNKTYIHIAGADSDVTELYSSTVVTGTVSDDMLAYEGVLPVGSTSSGEIDNMYGFLFPDDLCMNPSLPPYTVYAVHSANELATVVSIGTGWLFEPDVGYDAATYQFIGWA